MFHFGHWQNRCADGNTTPEKNMLYVGCAKIKLKTSSWRINTPEISRKSQVTIMITGNHVVQ